MHKFIIVSLHMVALFSFTAGGAGGEVCASVGSPGALNQIVLSLSSQQAVGQPFVGTAQIVLLDENSELLTSYDLAADPITLSVTSGSLVPNIIDNPALFSNGIINLSPLNIRYLGESGPVNITASNSSLNSATVLVSFSGYDILEAVDLAADTTSTVYANITTSIRAIVRNGGDLSAIEDPSLKAFFRSGGGSVKQYFAGSSGGLSDTVTLGLPTGGLSPGDDTLVLVAESRYSPAADTLDVNDTLLIPVEVVAADGLTLVGGSLKPDSVYAGVPFDLSFEVAATALQEPIDSTVLTVSILSDSDSLLTVAFGGRINHTSFLADTLTYDGIDALIDSALGLASGSYVTSVDYTLHIKGLALTASTVERDTIDILQIPPLAYEAGSLMPGKVSPGEEFVFQFVLQLNYTAPVHIDVDHSFFELVGSGFSVSTYLDIASDSLSPGSNQVRTREISVPSGILDQTLTARVTVVYAQGGVANQASLLSDFEGEEIGVQELALIQIVETSIIAPNAPQVNTGQAFQILCRVANLSTSPMDPFDLQLVSDGLSAFDPMVAVDGILGEDIIEVDFDVTAAATPRLHEIFRVDIDPLIVNQRLPVDNIAMATVQRPADLAVSLIPVGADEGYVNVGEGFDLLIWIINMGEAEATAGRFQINTNGIYLGLPDSALIIEAVVAVGGVREFSFVAPSFDTMIVINVDLMERPLDLNTGMPALISDTAFSFSLAVTSADVSLEIELSGVPSNLVIAGEQKDLFELHVTNPGESSVSDIKLEALSLYFSDAIGDPLGVRSVLEVGSTALYENDRRVTRATAGGNQLNLLFEDFVVEAETTDTLVLKAKILAEADGEFAVTLDAGDVLASFAAGPLAGRPVGATSSGDEGLVLEEVYTTVEGTLDGSFMVRNNPFNPDENPAEFRYYLDRADRVQFLILTLSGEIVFEKEMAAGDVGATIGENVIFWDGRNNGGSMVVNGVYVAMINLDVARQQTSLKLAVMK